MTIAENLAQIQQQIQSCEIQYGRAPQDVRLLAVSKTKPTAAIQEAYEAGQRLFGENYVQEVVSKKAELGHLSDIEWHFIGPIQSNKSRSVAECVDWVHTIDREKIAQRLNDQRPDTLSELNVCIQVNLSGETSKSGVQMEDVLVLAERIQTMPRLVLRGLMAIPAPQQDEASQIAIYRPLQDMYQQLRSRYNRVDTLSIGMSGDMSAAIAAGSTIVRIGTAIFGERDYTR